jgi:hypothetical protein
LNVVQRKETTAEMVMDRQLLKFWKVFLVQNI